VRDSDDREHVAHVFAEYDLIAMPVIDADGKLVGIITSDDVVDVVVSEATEDVHRMGAVGPLAEDYLQTPFFALWRNRVFWLGVLLFGQTFTIEAMAYYEDNLKVMAVLAIFVPLCLSTGGNSGSQASTLINRAMSLGQIQIGDWFKATRHELLMGVALGLSLALLAAARTWWFTKPEWLLNPDDRPPTDLTRLTFVISLAIFALCVSGTLIGTLLPLLFKRLGADPAVASTPFVATFADVTGIVIYFSVARLIFGAALG
jgi:magnesium transporter